jgi:GNAT superfamily N-acetyltransferase
MDEPSITIEEAVEVETAARVEAIVNRYNVGVMGSDWRPMNLLLRLPGGKVIGGLLGATEWGWLHVEVLAIENPYRGRGLGSRLLAAAEQEAMARGCRLAYLSTFSFQARPFYEKRGYEAFGTLEGAGPHAKYWMRKNLADAVGG